MILKQAGPMSRKEKPNLILFGGFLSQPETLRFRFLGKKPISLLEERMFKLLGITGLMGLSLLNTGCSIDSALFGVKVPDVAVLTKTQGAEIVSGSTQYRLTSNNYLVSDSAGSVYDKVTGTTSNGYKVYITVQGQMLSEEDH